MFLSKRLNMLKKYIYLPICLGFVTKTYAAYLDALRIDLYRKWELLFHLHETGGDTGQGSWMILM